MTHTCRSAACPVDKLQGDVSEKLVPPTFIKLDNSIFGEKKSLETQKASTEEPRS